jgi:RecB family exonuclease
LTGPPLLQIAHYRDIAAAVAQRLVSSREGADPLSPWAEEVIVPSRGMAEAIAAAVLERTPRGVASLQIRFIDELALRVLNDANEFPRAASDAERRLAMRMAVRTVDHPMMEGRGIAAMLERSYRDVRDSGLTIADLSANGLRNPARTRAIVRAFTEYERLIALLGATDPAEIFARAATAIGEVRPQIVAGFYDMTGAQLAFLRALGAHIAAIYVPTDMPFAKRFTRAFGDYTSHGSYGSYRTYGTYRTYETHHGELEAVVGAIRALLDEGVPANGIALVARSLAPYDARLINRLARQRGFRTTLKDEIPLTAHRIGRGAVTLLRLRERGFPRGEVLELVRDGIHTRTRIDVDRADYETRKQRLAGGTSEELELLRNRSRVIDDYLDLVAELEELTLAPDLIGRLPSLFRIETELDLDAASQLDEIAALFKRASVWNRGVEIAAVIDAIEHCTIDSRSTLDPRPSTPIIWAGDVMRFRGRSFQHVFVVRMQDDVFPQRRTEDPLLPDSDRKLLGVREIGDGRDEEQLLLQLILDSTEHAHFTCANGDGFGKVLRPSRYLRGFGTSVPRYLGTSITDTPGGTEVQRYRGTRLRPLQMLVRSGTRSIFDGYLPSLGAHVREKMAAVSPTQLEDFGECPQKFLLKHILGVEDIEHPERELQINPRDKGTLDHRILERFYRNTPAHEIAGAVVTEAMGARLDSIIDEQFDALEAAVPSFNRTIRAIERRATKRLLRDFVANDLADLAAQNLLPRHFEYRFGAKHHELADHPEPFIVHAGGVPVRVEGTIDRIDTSDARLRIVDYKSGKALRHANLPEKIDRGVRLQLALYAMAAAEFFERDAASVSATIRPLVAGEGKPRFAFELQEKKDGLLETLNVFLTSIVSGLFPAFPNDSDQEFNSCKYCPVNHSCRTRHDQEERYAVQQQRDPRTLLSARQV